MRYQRLFDSHFGEFHLPVVAVQTQSTIYEIIARAQPAPAQSCDWLRDRTALGLVIFPLRIYRLMEEHNGRNPVS